MSILSGDQSVERGSPLGFVVRLRLTAKLLFGVPEPVIPNAQPLFNLVCTNVPGPQIPLYVAGRTVEALWPLVPLSGGLGLNFCLTSYNGVLYWGIVGDPDLVPDVAIVARAIESSFAALKAAAMAAA